MLKNNKNKKNISFTLCLIFFFQLVLSFNYTNKIALSSTLPEISYSVIGDITVGKEFTISVNVSNISNLYGASIDFKYNPSLISVISITPGSLFDGQAIQIPVQNIDNTNGVVNLGSTMTGEKSGITSTGKSLYIIKAKALKAGSLSLNTISDNSSLSLINSVRVKLASSSVDKIPYTSTKLDIAIKEPIIPLTVGKYEESNPNIKYVGTWLKYTNANNSGGNSNYSTTSGNYIEFTFNGTGFKWAQPVNSSRGIAKVTIDGVVQNVDTYSSSTIFQKVVLSKTGLSSGIHTIKIEVTSSKNVSSIASIQALDYVEILNESQTLVSGKYEENNPALKYVGTWIKYSNANNSGGNSTYSTTSGNYVEFTFNGTGFKWAQPVNSSRGIAKVTIDGVVQNVDTYSSSTIFQKIVLSKTGLSNGIHTIKIEVTSSKNTSSITSIQALDYIEILN